MSKSWTFIETLQYTRHDWLNRLQLIKGNLSLGKADQAERVIEDIIREMQQETMLTNLELPLLAEVLLTHNWSGQHFRLHYELIGKAAGESLDDRKLADWVEELLLRLNHAAHPYHENHLYLTIDASEEDVVRFLFQFDGILENGESLAAWLESEERFPSRTAIERENEQAWLISADFKLLGQV